jgi:hypothetical protein
MSAQHYENPEVTFQPDHSGGTKRIWKIRRKRKTKN